MANTNANGRVVAPAVLQAQLSTDVVGFNLENNQASALGQQYITFQETFLPGEVTTSTHLVAIVGGQKIPVQMDVKTTNADGSVRSALLTFEQPSISADSSLSFMLSTTGTAIATGPLSLASLNDSNYDLKVTIALQGGSTVVLDAATLLEQALNAGTVSYWQTGPLATQGRVDVPIAGSLHVTLDITMYADGSTSTDVQFNNDYAMQAVGGTAVYNVTIQQNGSTVLQQSNITEYQYQTWHTVVSTTGPSQANVVQDINYLQLTGAVPNLDLTSGVDPSTLSAERITGNQILGPGSVTQYMPSTGGRADIGLMPAWNAIWLVTQDQQAAQYALAQADAAGSVPWHYFDPKTGTYLSLDDYPTLWTDPRGTPSLTQQPSGSSGWTPDGAHAPDLSYVAYLLTGDRYYLDQLNAQATFAVFYAWPDPRENGLGLVANGYDQVRQQAWSLRVIDEAAWANPTGSVEQTTFAQLANNNWSWLVSQIPTWTQQQGQAYGYVPGAYRDGMAPWQQDYFASVAIQAAQMGNADALTFLNWQANFLVGRFLNSANGFNPHDGVAYSLNIEDSTGTNYKTWAQIEQATVAAGNSNGSGWANGDYAELAAQTLAGIITLTGSAAATQAYNWLMSSGAPQITPYFVDPQFDIDPGQTVSTGSATLSIAAADATQYEGETDTTTAFAFTVTRGGNTSIASSASWAVTGSGANPAAGSDFAGAVFPSGTVSFAAGETSKTITVNVAGNTVVEPNEGFAVTLSNPAANTTIGTASAGGTIRDDDGASSLSIAALSADKVEGQSGSTGFTFTVTRGGNTSIASSASWAVTGSGANPAAGSDFAGAVFPSGTVSFAAGETSKTITVNVAGDTVVEPDEGFTVTLSNPAASTTIGTATAGGRIRNDDTSQASQASLSIAALSADKVEGQSGSTGFTFMVTRGGDTSIATSANWAVAGSGANPAAGSDFAGAVFPSGTVSFAAGETSKTITVNVAGDAIVEPNEGFTVTLSNPAASTTIGTATAGGTIRGGGGSAAIGEVTGLSQDTGIPGDFITSVANQTVSGTYTGALAADDAIQVSADGSIWVSATAGAGTWTADVTLLPGEHTLSVRTVDDVGNIVNGTGHTYDLENGGGGGDTIVLNVGAGQAYATLSAAVAASRDGDVIAVQAGTYVNDFATISKDITIVGVGGMANFVATVAPPNGKGILVTQSDVTIQNLSFSGAAVADMNGAGIRYEGGNLVIINSYFHHNQDGLLANADPNGTIRIVGSEFANNGASDGYSHNLYVGNIASLVIDDSFFHDASVGHQIKSRAQSTTITNSRIYDGNGTGSYSIDLPNGGVGVIRDNVIQQGQNSDNPAIIHYGGESAAYAGSSLLIEDNVVVNDMSGSSSVRLLSNATTVAGTVRDNAVYGLTAGQIATGGATVSGTTYLSAHPSLDTSAPWLDAASGGGGPAAVGQVTGLSQDTGTPGDFITNVANQTVSGTYTGALAAGDVIQVSANASTWVGATAGAGTWTADLTLLPGEHTLSVRTVDDAGNIVNGTSHAYDLDLTGPAAVGEVTGLSQDTGTPGDFITSVASQTVNGTYTGALAAGDVIQVSANASTWVGATAGAGTWTADLTLLPGEHTLSVRTVDDAGNIVNGTSHAYDLDLTGPAAVGEVTGLSQDTGTPGDFITSVASQTVNGTYTGALAAGDVIQVSANGSTWVGATAGAGTWTADVTLLPGEHTLAVRTVDDAGNIVNGASHAYDLQNSGGGSGDTILGTAGADRLVGTVGADTMTGLAGNDEYVVNHARDVVIEAYRQGTDTVLSSVSYRLAWGQSIENLTLTGDGNTNGTGNSLNNVLQGTTGNNVLRGGGGNDTLTGDLGDDVLVGGFGRDIETGGAGADRFDFNAFNESGTTSATRDRIVGFEQGIDTIDFSTIDANTASWGNQAFTFIGDIAFHGVAGELRQQAVDADTIVSGDINGDTVADFQIQLNGAFALTPNDFSL